ncbi:hypothetical protein ACIPJK_38800 [Streptomyces roseus]|uniref:hypothetical protein n=1 Tax=Streptomyces roseus TaxID=66430 RepID=UPI0038118A24
MASVLSAMQASIRVTCRELSRWRIVIRSSLTSIALTAAAFTGVVATAGPAAAGGIGDLLSPAFGTDCANRDTGAIATAVTAAGTGMASRSVLGVPVGSPLNQCGGADLAPSRPGVDLDTREQNIYYSDVLQDVVGHP